MLNNKLGTPESNYPTPTGSKNEAKDKHRLTTHFRTLHTSPGNIMGSEYQTKKSASQTVGIM